jgi:hypothetical protein
MCSEADLDSLGPAKGTEIITPFPVPIHSRLEETNKAVILTNEKPSLPVPEIARKNLSNYLGRNMSKTVPKFLCKKIKIDKTQ